MAWAQVETKIANPATGRRKGRKNMAARRRLSAKHIKAGFGGKRRQSALKTKRHSARALPVKRTPKIPPGEWLEERHSARARPVKRNAAPKRRIARKAHRASPRPKIRKKRNLAEAVSIFLPGLAGNPARKKGKTMAAKKRKTKRATAQRNAGTRRTVRKVNARRRTGRRNPGKVMEYLTAGVAVVGGAVGSKVATQVVLGSKNTGLMGYGGNLVATGLLGWAAHAFFKDKLVSQMVIAGGIAQVIVRAIGEQTPYGQYLSGAGVGDYQVSNFLVPQRMMPNAMQSAALEQNKAWGLAPPASVVVTHSAGAATGVGNWKPDWD
jgi:hypothetical protein